MPLISLYFLDVYGCDIAQGMKIIALAADSGLFTDGNIAI
jgi:hypothetical protein